MEKKNETQRLLYIFSNVAVVVEISSVLLFCSPQQEWSRGRREAHLGGNESGRVCRSLQQWKDRSSETLEWGQLKISECNLNKDVFFKLLAMTDVIWFSFSKSTSLKSMWKSNKKLKNHTFIWKKQKFTNNRKHQSVSFVKEPTGLDEQERRREIQDSRFLFVTYCHNYIVNI